MRDHYAVKVADLAVALAELKPDDVLVPNEVQNLAVYRNGEYYGWLDFFEDARINLVVD